MDSLLAWKETVSGSVRSFFTEYETPKLVLIHSGKFAGLLRVTQIIILIYSFGYLMIYEKGYQKSSTTVISSVTIKVKGIGYVNLAQNRTIIIDAADYTMPPLENNAIFIVTNFIQTDQIRTKCAESNRVKGAVCTTDSDCTNKPLQPSMNGRWTGRCLFSTEINDTSRQTTNVTSNSSGLCEYSGWCPPENDQGPTMLVEDTMKFTIFVKNFIEFPAFSVKHKNMADGTKPCIFDPKTEPDCPIFPIDYILNEAEPDVREREQMSQFGGVVRIKIDYDCNLDRNIKVCKPMYSFARLDAPFREKSFSVGFNFRYASTWKDRLRSRRTLTKAYGYRFIIAVSGKAGKFNFITLTLNIGSVVGIFGLATIICDFFILNISKQADIYRHHVFQIVHLRTRLNSVMGLPRNRVQHIYEQYANNTQNQVEAIEVETRESSPKRSSSARPKRGVTFANVATVDEDTSVERI